MLDAIFKDVARVVGRMSWNIVQRSVRKRDLMSWADALESASLRLRTLASKEYNP